MLGNHHLPVQLMLVYELHLLGTNPLAFWQHGQAVTDTATTTPVGSCKCYMQSLLQGKLNGAESEGNHYFYFFKKHDSRKSHPAYVSHRL